MPTLICDLGVLNPLQRQRRETLLGLLARARRQVDELPHGYRLGYGSGQSVWKLVAEWVDLERRTCPFLHFTLGCEEDGRVWLEIEGMQGVKGFLEEHLSLDNRG